MPLLKAAALLSTHAVWRNSWQEKESKFEYVARLTFVFENLYGSKAQLHLVPVFLEQQMKY